MVAITKLGPGRFTSEVTIEVEDGSVCRASARITQRDAVTSPPPPAWAGKPIRVTGDVPRARLTVPIIPVCDLAAVTDADELALVRDQAVFSTSGPAGTFMLVVKRDRDALRGVRLSEAGLSALATRLGEPLTPSGEPVQFELRPVRREREDG
jgi:hypothetical protein